MYILIFQGTFEDEISLSQGGIWNSSLEGMYIYIYTYISGTCLSSTLELTYSIFF